MYGFYARKFAISSNLTQNKQRVLKEFSADRKPFVEVRKEGKKA